MASSSSSSSSASLVLQQPQPHHESIEPHLLRLLVTLINHHFNRLLSDSKSRKILQTRCLSNLKSQHFNQPSSEESIISNLYWGIHNVEAAIQDMNMNINTKANLQTSEKMFQPPALLNENGMTAGVSNAFLVSCSYFYLAMLRKLLLQRDELQVALHFLQALVVSPLLVRTELAPDLYPTILHSCILPLAHAHCFKQNNNNNHEEEEAAIVKWGAASYKAWLMYHQVISYGHSPLLMRDKSQQIRNSKACSTSSSSNSYQHLHLRTHQNLKKVHPIDPQHDKVQEEEEESKGIKRLQDLLLEDQSDSPTSLHSGTTDFQDDDSEENVDRSLRSLLAVADTETEITKSKAPNITSFSGILASSLSDLEECWNCSDDEEDEEPPSWQSFEREYFQGSCAENSYRVEQAEIVEKVISKLCFSEGLGKSQDGDDSATVEITTVYEMLATKPGLKYSLLKDVILDQLLMALSTSKEEGVTRASVSILSSIISGNPSVIQEIKKKGLNLDDLANALKRDVHEAAVLIYLINPSPNEIKTLQLMPTLVKIINNSASSSCYQSGLKSLLLTPPSASLMIIQVLVTAFDHSTNNTHLAAITSPKVISSLLNVPRNGDLEQLTSLAAILVKCMRFNGQCRYYILQEFTPISPFISLILSNHKHAILSGLEFYHELLRMPRSSSVSLLQQLREGGGIDIMCVLLLAIQQTQQEYKLLAASLLLQLDVLEDSLDNILNREVATEALLESLTCEENSDEQQLAAFILSNLGGTFSRTGEPCTIAWLLKKAGLNSIQHKNIVKNIDWSDDTLQENGTEIWCGKVARHVMKVGSPVFYALEKGVKSKNKRVSRDCLTVIAWIGCEIVKGPNDLRCLACDMLLSTIEQYVHPGMELEERLLACLCIYNYTFGRGMHKLTQFSEGVRESLRRLSSITWMAEELLKVADYYMPNKWRISCVHTQVLEANYNGGGAVNSLIYYMGQLFSGYANGSIKVWDIKGQTTTLVSDIKEHKKAVTCFALLEPGNCLLSGSADKTIRIWRMLERKLQCVEVITTKDPIQSLQTCGELIFAVTHSHKVKVFDSSRKAKDVFKNKHVKCIRASQGKLYIGCMDSSIQELSTGNNRQQEIKAPSKSWMMQNKPINSISVYKDWLYSASSCVDGSRIKDWRRQSKGGQVCIVASERRSNVVAMSIVEDFIYINNSCSSSNLEIWLRGAEHKVGRLSAGSKITSMLTANDMILCGTESGLIKGWIPL